MGVLVWAAVSLLVFAVLAVFAVGLETRDHGDERNSRFERSPRMDKGDEA